MSRKDHPNNTPGIPMVFPVWFENFQVKYFNPLVKPIARYLPTFSIIKHRGRTSGKPYETIVTAYRKGNVLAIGLAHGKTDWVKNVLAAGEADLHFIRKNVHITNARVCPPEVMDTGCPSSPAGRSGGSRSSSAISPSRIAALLLGPLRPHRRTAKYACRRSYRSWSARPPARPPSRRSGPRQAAGRIRVPATPGFPG